MAQRNLKYTCERSKKSCFAHSTPFQSSGVLVSVVRRVTYIAAIKPEISEMLVKEEGYKEQNVRQV
jgi:hypothetical protein